MAQKKKIINERAKPGSGVQHDKHAPASKEDIKAAKATAKEVAEADE